jgi:hypothetical protein
MAVLEVSASPEVCRSASSATPSTVEIHTDRQLRAEQAMVRASILGFLVSLPIGIAVLVGMMAVAIGDTQPWYVWGGLGVGMGIYAAGFLGATAGVLLSARRLNRIAGGQFL